MPISPIKIRAVMQSAGVTQAELSRRTGIAPPNIVRLLSGDRSNPALGTAERVADALGVPIKAILLKATRPKLAQAESTE